VRNPFRSEADAYRLVWLTIGYFVLIVVGALINVWVGVAVFVVETAVVVWWVFLRRGEEAEPPREAPAPSPEGEHRILVVANETVAGRSLRDEVVGRAQEGDAEVLVVTPALNTRIRHWTSDEDTARAAAQIRLDESLASLSTDGIDARGVVGDDDPLQAIEDSLRMFPADEIVVSTHPPGRSNWLEHGIVERAGERFDLPITHVVVDLEREAEARRSA